MQAKSQAQESLINTPTIGKSNLKCDVIIAIGGANGKENVGESLQQFHCMYKYWQGIKITSSVKIFPCTVAAGSRV